ncbi:MULTISPECIES: AtpZ/AtpI family protein [Aeromonas]|uniref:F0F1 ATP synthase subunit n=2 Tax=Gammaproteobacteria TaxID=1236 RepID=A0A3L0W0K8_ECOLX|nr:MULTISPECIES: AtpZ/AtpI family protein [Aeromonas]MCE9932961.1 AtpZ/AtpI family protein [Aeromonas salmonicida]MCE9970824.1 AtpZ/AtpI family protein [Aeromonas salmonicida]MDF2400073.1 F0F1 ATP synthase subunit [Aeromonas sp. 5HA1]MDM5099697.1 AtpZ/AtpI family protein [Aeromonas salmonicida]WCH21830.1 AtpZ/AtpI family protein [Aeromonas salmonicida]
MTEQGRKPGDGKRGFSELIGNKAERKVKAQQQVTRTVWSGLGMMGLIGWSIAIPTLLGAALGLWLDERYPGGQSWTLALLAAGLTLGCFNAWRWLAKEDSEIHDKGKKHDE